MKSTNSRGGESFTPAHSISTSRPYGKRVYIMTAVIMMEVIYLNAILY